MTDLELLWAIDKYLPDKYLPLFHEMEKQAAAAPDLLAACKVALNAINLNDETLTAREHLQAAIAKATQP